MRVKILAFLAIAALLSTGTSWASTRSSKKATKRASDSSKSKKGKHKKASAKKGSWRTRGQKQIADDRTREIQTALVKEGYLTGEPSGVMDDRTKAALTKLQSDNGWQTKIVPDSRALIKLGLGPDQSNIINPDSAALAQPVSGGGNQ
ncbi:MAG TPA: peptidoglycan-binding protein [Terriglobales bacterium]|nr:peptidoglycan-binding protein [Terriglobales bacterium]